VATAKTKALTAPLVSRYARLIPAPTPPDDRAAILKTPAGQRKVLGVFSSADGRAVYAYDGVSYRQVKA
jgi:hypothetical protein